MRPVLEAVPRHIADALDELGELLGGKVVCLALLSEERLSFCFPGNAGEDTIRRLEEVMYDLLTEELLDEA